MIKESFSTQLRPLTFDEAVAEYMLNQRACRNSPRTIAKYGHMLNIAKAWLVRNSVADISEITANHIRQFLVDLQEETTQYGRPYSPCTLLTLYKCLKAFFRFHEDELNIAASPMRRLKAPRQDKKILPAFTEQEIQTMLAANAGRDCTAMRNKAMICFLLDSGLRLEELSKMRLSDIDLKTGTVKVVGGKGGKDRMTRIGAKSLLALNRYLRVRHFPESKALWTGSQGPMSRAGIVQIFERLEKKTGIHIHPHKFRRTMAISMLRAGCDIFSLQMLLGHAELDVLRRYLDQTELDLETAHERFGTVDHLR